MIVIISLIVVFQMLRMPSPKVEMPTYTLGTPVPTQAKYYLNNVSDAQNVSVKKEQFKEGVQTVDVTLDKTVYQVKISVIKPNLKDITKTTNFVRVMAVGGSLETLFGLSSDYANDAKFSVDSKTLSPGKHTITLTLFDQSVQQQVEVVDTSKTPGNVAAKYPVKNVDLVSLIKSYLQNEKIDESSIAMVYQNLNTKDKIAFNETKTMLAAETAYLPIGMFAFDEIKAGSIAQEKVKSLIESMVLVSSSDAFSQAVSVLGGREKVYAALNTYGKSSGVTQTISATSQQTTADYLAQVIHYLYTHQNDYTDMLNYMKSGDAKTFISRHLGDTPVAHKTGYVGQVINDVAIVYESTPYALTLLSRDITGVQFVEIAFLINEWHKANQ
ncbi:serine hydrolase [Carnobacteriaceae bacterium zg-ZUI240]|nr:serine hydrolase [Carnobacteriaceae bacterium zg-ZUI240]